MRSSKTRRHIAQQCRDSQADLHMQQAAQYEAVQASPYGVWGVLSMCNPECGQCWSAVTLLENLHCPIHQQTVQLCRRLRASMPACKSTSTMQRTMTSNRAAQHTVRACCWTASKLCIMAKCCKRKACTAALFQCSQCRSREHAPARQPCQPAHAAAASHPLAGLCD